MTRAAGRRARCGEPGSSALARALALNIRSGWNWELNIRSGEHPFRFAGELGVSSVECDVPPSGMNVAWVPPLQSKPIFENQRLRPKDFTFPPV